MIVFVCALLWTVTLATGVGAQARPAAVADVIARMRADLAARNYAMAIGSGNALLESSRVLTPDQRLELWQVLAAAYYPDEPRAQQPDSALLPLDALVHMVPDVTMAPELSWPGLDSLLERTRARVFVVATRPLAEYTIARDLPAHLTVVASRPTRFRLTSVATASGATVVHDAADSVTAASLRFRSHDATGPVFNERAYELQVWAYDLLTGDSVAIVHRATATRVVRVDSLALRPAGGDVPPPLPPARTTAAGRGRSTMLVGALGLAGATVAIATGARAGEPLRSAFATDGRAFVVSGVMVAAAVTAFVVGRQRRPAGDRARVEAATTSAPAPARRDDDRVTLRLDPPER